MLMTCDLPDIESTLALHFDEICSAGIDLELVLKYFLSGLGMGEPQLWVFKLIDLMEETISHSTRMYLRYNAITLTRLIMGVFTEFNSFISATPFYRVRNKFVVTGVNFADSYMEITIEPPSDI